ncbi:MAG: ribosomal subunit interface protein [Planctomycetales bacterium 4484_113]|nr:MAG: ribosomal subunit interface protein [Planctomycetales bacterium 4484_113]
MQPRIKGKNFKITDRLKDYAARKTARLSRLFDRIMSADVEFVDEGGGKGGAVRKAEITLNANGQVLRAEVVSGSFYASFDEAIDKVERQLRKYKSKLIQGRRGAENEIVPSAMATAEASANDHPIARRKTFTIRPMTAEEAVLQMELSGHDFFLFRDAESAQICAVYKRRARGYGLLIPEEEV